MEFSKLVSERYSCKKYSGQKVNDDILRKIVDLARLAPTAKNLQEYHIYILKSDEALKIIDTLTPCRYGAPVVMMVAFDKTNVYTYPGESRNSGIEDATIVATHLTLAATECGVNSCWLNNFDPDKAKDAFSLPENEEVLMLLDIGYAAEGSGPLPNHSLRKSVDEVISYK